MAETAVERAARLREESLKAAEKKLKLVKGLGQRVKEGEQEALGALGAATEPGAAAIRRQSAEQLAQAITATPRTGLGARLAAARGIGQRGLTAEADFRAEQKAREAEIRKGTAQKLAEAELAVPEAELEKLKFEKDLASAAEDKTAMMADALDDVNSKLPEFDKLFWEDEEGAANMIRNVALRYRNTWPELDAALRNLAQQIESEEVELEEIGQITPAMLGL